MAASRTRLPEVNRLSKQQKDRPAALQKKSVPGRKNALIDDDADVLRCEKSANAREDAAHGREKAADLREDAARQREKAAEIREGEAHAREKAAEIRVGEANARRGVVTLRELVVRPVDALQSTRDDHLRMMQDANAQLHLRN
ncbi:hypothetical protein C8R31_101342 [Nitrosospira sp. Nsp2]|uniref:hypothetical protein n=1 Tax=Nitrosospira sp. Nsp2 TaxID=136548 RepID=UPI000D425681|nr:hypothetical protein [Nitrosospira sp. Nsp2]PTR17184.1 hypothetical protein C8R31_101342 [Nitrosospira sp. Nsp2]